MALDRPPAQPIASEPSRAPCHNCQASDKTSFSCIQCNNLTFCDDCWSKWVLHAPGAVGWDGRPHERSNPQVVQRLRQILEPTLTQDEYDSELLADEDTTWFGIGRDSSNQPIFQDHGRFAALMSESQNPDIGARWPQLVSFIGQTGAGKSTLIKMLINRLESVSTVDGSKFPSPATSSINDRLPMTGDVHLYADPESYHTRTPMLYADCEGLDGGESIPRGLQHRSKDRSESTSGRLPSRSAVLKSKSTATDRSSVYYESKKKLKKNPHGSERDIVWAVTPNTKKREYAVTQLYPRLLYTFSDVVVFVLRNPRAFESTVLEKLLEWGAASIDKSINQPALPHAIIVMNATDKVDESEWNVETATKLLLDHVKGAIFREPRFEEHAKMWRQTGRRIHNTKDLLECYYASITVVRIPSRGRYMLMDDQVDKLFKLVQVKCRASLSTKKRVRMLATSEQLQMYLQAAYDHFSRDLDTPFDFIKQALKYNPIPRDFGGNIFNLAMSIREHSDDPEIKKADPAAVFDKIRPMISSCIMLDSVRQNLMGTTERLLNDAYIEFCEQALDRYVDLCAPCSYVHPRYGRCCNFKAGHIKQKGHQNQEGRMMAEGAYESSFDMRGFLVEWVDRLKSDLVSLQDRFIALSHTLRDWTEPNLAAALHKEELNHFYGSLGKVSDFVSHHTCFSCLRELPEHALPCGHVLCSPCIKSYGRTASRTKIHLSTCPLHQGEWSWEPPWEITMKPPFAGTRILCLDGGGVRGIVELQVLKAIEKILGPGLPIQLFFDLIVGTSTGGILTLGLGAKNWPVADCIAQFKELCETAFSKQKMIGAPILEKISMTYHGSMYKTKPFEALLKERFEEGPLFGGATQSHEMVTKVAVTSTTVVAQQAVILTNYNRPDPDIYDLPYKLVRTAGPETEFKMWEAARATAAAPPFFKQFIKQDTQSGYVDGALYHNNPVWVAHHERRLIWGDVATAPPDILLSVGTGTNTTGEARTPYRQNRFPSEDDEVTSPTGKGKTSTPSWKVWWNIATDRFDRLLECDSIWKSFIAETIYPELDNNDSHRRFIRINPDLRYKVPRLNEVNELGRLEKAANEYLNQNIARTKEVAHRLIASTFFFEKTAGSVKQQDTNFTCEGRIYCRFDQNSDEMKALGELLRGYLRGSFEPFFFVEEKGYPTNSFKMALSEPVINDMCLRGTFNLQRIQIRTSKELASTMISLSLQTTSYPYSTNAHLPISGFPRELMTEDTRSRGTPSRHKLVASRQSGDFRYASPKNAPQRFQSVRANDREARAAAPDLSRYQPKARARIRKHGSGRNLRGAFGNLDIRGKSTDSGDSTGPRAVGAKYPDRPDDVGQGGGERGQGEFSYEDFVYELEA